MIRIRRLTPEDIPALTQISAGEPNAPSWGEREFAALFATEAPVRILLGAEVSGTDASTLAGFAVALPVSDQCELESIVVAHSHQRQGIARQLLATLLSELRRGKVQELLLEVRVSNGPALAFYRAEGFLLTGRRSNYYQHPVEDALVMGLKLYP